MSKTAKKELSHSESQAKAQLESIKEMVEALADNVQGEGYEDALQTILDDPLSVEVRSGWHTAGDEDNEASEYMILLCTGGPACRIVGSLDHYATPETAHLEHQDWGTPWMDYPLSHEEQEIVKTYARQFYFGD